MKNNNKTKIMKLAANIHGWIYRIKFFKRIKQELLNEQNKYYEDYSNKFSPILKVFLDIEKFYKKTYDNSKWKEFYTEKEYLNDFANEEKFKNSFYRKIFIGWTNDNNQFFYNGFLNINNQKHGKGVLVTIEAKYEGYWLNDELYGWCMITNTDGFIYEGNF